VAKTFLQFLHYELHAANLPKKNPAEVITPNREYIVSVLRL